jgi:hypothetical protein
MSRDRSRTAVHVLRPFSRSQPEMGQADYRVYGPARRDSSVDPGRSSAFRTSSWLKIELADLGTTISVMKAEKANENFATGVLSTNKSKEFAAQIEEARRRVQR